MTTHSQKRLITLTTDFGIKDPFVGVIKGVICGINPNVYFIDITHEIEPYNIREASYVLYSAYKYFPAGTIHLSIVDPGVGSNRKKIVAVTDKYYFIAPDNGILSLIISDKDVNIREIIEITNTSLFLPNISATFHGRDIFAPVAGWLSTGLSIDSIGKRTETYVKLPSAFPAKVEDNVIKGEIIYIDRFGNLHTNIIINRHKTFLNSLLSDTAKIEIGRIWTIRGLKQCYNEGSTDYPSLIINSWGVLEIFLYNANAAKRLEQLLPKGKVEASSPLLGEKIIISSD